MQHISDDGTVYERQGAGPTILLVHGLGLNRNMWQWLMPDLLPHFDVISFDLFGHGDSPKPPSPPSLTLFSSQISTIIKAVGAETAAIVGFSLGGMIVRRFACDYPNFTSGMV